MQTWSCYLGALSACVCISHSPISHGTHPAWAHWWQLGGAGGAGAARTALSRGQDGLFGMAAGGSEVSLKEPFFLGCGESSLQEQHWQLDNPAGLRSEARAPWM